MGDPRDRTSDTQLKELLRTVLDALVDVRDRLDEMENEQDGFVYEGALISVSQDVHGFTAEVNGIPTGDRYPSQEEAIDGAEGLVQSLQ